MNNVNEIGVMAACEPTRLGVLLTALKNRHLLNRQVVDIAKV